MQTTTQENMELQLQLQSDTQGNHSYSLCKATNHVFFVALVPQNHGPKKCGNRGLQCEYKGMLLQGGGGYKVPMANYSIILRICDCQWGPSFRLQQKTIFLQQTQGETEWGNVLKRRASHVLM
eukprot:CAMPEP_0174317724 /NCGR_PEP_ID=MMETSP0810-20121108/7752_1 /TAXON_ID=73025 ORGANISM="Eutreptiella gymnastica-like, Strain CCMP1594" /NCGR_SAMPLE_ID=MMETSP0810 /ASSEMBLY_ACC=CAM_ASM_000659 /LENGTH=122 /DNA_ID=CAMNT_0015427755 /DNA_START=733 /DNA_END=1101 /DNA_ORIENTATION=-